MQVAIRSKIPAIYEATKPFSDSIVAHQKDNSVPINYGAYRSGLNAYMESIVSINNPEINPNELSMALINRDGWAMAGSYYWKLAQIRDYVDTTVKAYRPLPIGAPDYKVMGKAYQNGKIDPTKLDSVYLANARNRFLITRNNSSYTDNAVAPAPATISTTDTIDSYSKKQAKYISESITYWLYIPENGETDPIFQARHLGNKILRATTVMAGSTVLASAVIGGMDRLAEKVPVVGAATGLIAGAWGVVQPFIMSAILLFLGLSFLYTTVIPMMPYVLFMFAVMGYLIYVVEAMVAAPLFAVFHAHPEGEGIKSSMGGNGYMIILSLILRPGLIIIGFFAGMFISKIMGAFLYKTFFDTFSLGQTADWTIILTQLFGVILYGMLLVALVYKSFDMCHELPDAVMKWIGGGATDLGEKQGSNTIVGGATAVGSRVEDAAGKARMNANMGNPKEGGGGGNKTPKSGGETGGGGGDGPATNAAQEQSRQSSVGERAKPPQA